MRTIKLTNIEYISEHKLKLTFDDEAVKYLDFDKLIEYNGVAAPLKEQEYFKQVKIINSGRSFGWDNDYDCCTDWVRYYVGILENNLAQN